MFAQNMSICMFTSRASTATVAVCPSSYPARSAAADRKGANLNYERLSSSLTHTLQQILLSRLPALLRSSAAIHRRRLSCFCFGQMICVCLRKRIRLLVDTLSNERSKSNSDAQNDVVLCVHSKAEEREESERSNGESKQEDPPDAF